MRRSHTVNGVTTNYVYDVASSLPLVLQDGTNTLVYGLDLISSTDGAGNQTYFSYDGLGSVTDLTDGTGAVTDTYSYDIFGAVRALGIGSPQATATVTIAPGQTVTPGWNCRVVTTSGPRLLRAP